MAADDLDDEERAAVDKIRAGRKQDDSLRAVLWNDKGEGAEVPYG